MRKPFYKKSHGCWYVRVGAKDVRLDPNEEKAYELWAEMRDASTPIHGVNESFKRVAEAWLREFKSDTLRYKFDSRFIASFASHVGILKAKSVTRQHVTSWLNGKKPKCGRWSQRTKHDAFAAICRVFRWAADEGHLTRNPVATLKVANGQPRSTTVSPREHERMFRAASPAVRQVLIAAKSGARPRQIREVTSANVVGKTLVFKEHKTAHITGQPLVVYMTPCLMTLIKHLVKKYPEGPLFRTSTGNAWTKDYMGRKIRELRKKLKLSPIVTYSYRHTFATEKLLAGVPLATVAELMGHQDTRMVSRNYGHLDQHKDYLSQAAATPTQTTHPR